jgi:broad specificity phosphatase PhoE
VTHRLLLLRHGEVPSHRGDVAVTDRGLDGAEQVPGMTLDEAAAVPFFVEFFDHPDRIGWWLRLGDVPGDDAGAVARRIGHFAASLPDRTIQPAELTVGVTHSPVLRACALAHLGRDPGEPEWLTGLELSVSSDRSVAGWAQAEPASRAARSNRSR